MFHNEKHMNCCFVVNYLQSLFFRSPSSENAREKKMTTHGTEGAKQERHAVSPVSSRPLFSRPRG